ncbi:hypothetical protein [Opitutus sp. GAS368]|jgi:hypothetical protein|nr:hypothetical protein [Opitutus sp. GAS368]
MQPAEPLPVRFGLKITLSIGAAALSFRFLEQRFLRLKDRFTDKPAMS